jgi:putative ABC transport system ATP-binding protein
MQTNQITNTEVTTIVLHDLHRTFFEGGQQMVALDGVSLELLKGTFVAIMGATGSGKSTLLNCAAGLENPDTGKVRLLGQDIVHMSERKLSRFRRNNVGFVFQSYNLLSELTVEQNVLLPLRLGGTDGRNLNEVLEAVGLSGFAKRAVAGLSGGQRQRVAIARALITKPSIIFADEPTGALDPTTGTHILTLLRRAANANKCTVVMVTHDPRAALVADRLILLHAGKIVDNRPMPPDPQAIAQLLVKASQDES